MITTGLVVALVMLLMLQCAAVNGIVTDCDGKARLAALVIILVSLVGDAGVIAALTRINGG